ncbi:hypothetical protein [Pseudoglutamicibacter cumminsii]|uniref:hypothetical protein n=1 Tax=Pseudoglutamicibacter cumminsii TaxID=156979 RepID=UPI00195EEEAB|nr:hypothetical protein [Pseudoglutamicibacter cumminsii]MBM7796877.1 hypothetical protein [Pseudoglutamicibacter cumminsii]
MSVILTETHTAHITTPAPGHARIRVITPGEGSSGVYSEAVLQLAVQEKAFPARTQCHINHDSPDQPPTGDARNLVGYLVEDAVWGDGAIEATVKVGEKWWQWVKDYGPVIGMSIQARAEVTEQDGKRVVERILPHPMNRVDFVTYAGRGGEVMEIYESANIAATEISSTTPVDAEKTPARPAGDTTTQKEEGHMSDVTITATEHARLSEASKRVPALEADLKEAREAREAAEKELAELVEARETELADAAEKAVRERLGDDAPAFIIAAAREAARSEAGFDPKTLDGVTVAAEAGEPHGTGTTATEGTRSISREDIANAL